VGELLALPFRRPRLVLALSLALALGVGAGMPLLRVDSSIESMIVANDIDHHVFEGKKQVFGSDEVVSIAIPFEAALSPEALAVQKRIAERLEALPDVTDVDALATTDDIVGRDDSLVVERLVPEEFPATPLDAEARARIQQRVASHPLWPGLLISEDGTTAAIQVHLEDPKLASGDRLDLLARIEAIAREEAGDREVHLAGHPYMKAEIARTMQHDLGLLLPMAVAAMALLLVVGIGSVRGAGVVLGCLLLAVVLMLGAMGWLDLPLTALSNTAPTILLALGTAYFMHFAARFQQEAAMGNAPARAGEAALRAVRRPTVIAGATTAIGFGSLTLSEISLVRGFGIDLALGIAGVVFLCCFTLPAAFVLAHPPASRGILTESQRLGRLLFVFAGAAARSPVLVVTMSLGVLVVAAWLASQLVVDSSGPNTFHRDSPFRNASEFYRERLSGDVIENLYVDVLRPDGVKDPDVLRRMLSFQAAAEEHPAIDSSVSLADYVTLMNRAVHEDDPEELRIPDTSAAVAQYLLLYSLSGDLDEFSDLVDGSYASARIVFTATVLSSRESHALREHLTALAEQHFAGADVQTACVSTEVLLSKAADALAREQVRSFATALLFIVLLVVVAFRSLRAGALLLLPNALPIALNLAVMAALGFTLNHSTALMAVIALGIAVDGTVHLLAAIQRGEQAGLPPRASVVRALLTTGRPVAVTGLIVTAGFSILLFSDFKVVAELGGFTALTMGFCLVADLVVLPAQWLLVRGLSERSALEQPGRSVGPQAALIQVAGLAIPALLVADTGRTAEFLVLAEEMPGAVALEAPVAARWLDGRPSTSGRLLAGDTRGPGHLRVAWTAETLQTWRRSPDEP
jgi:predicted RND superfamily exporter protein